MSTLRGIIDNLSDEQSWRLAEVYRILLSLANEQETASGGEFGHETPLAANDVPASEDRHHDSI